MTNPSPDLISYIRSGLVAQKTPDELRAELKTAGWADADVEAAFNSSSPSSATKPRVKMPWKWILIGVFALAVSGAGVAAFFFFGKKLTPAPATNLVNSPTVNVPVVSGAGSAAVNSPANTNSAPQDDASIDDSGLTISVENVPDADNAYLDAAALKSVTDKSDVKPSGDIKKQLSGDDPWDQKFIEDIVKKNKQPIADFAAAVVKPGFQIPEYNDPQSSDFATTTVDFGSIEKLVNILQLDALGIAKSGDVSDAAGEAFAVALYGQKMATSQIDEAGYLVGINIKKAGLETLQKILSTASLPSALAGQINSAFASFGATAPPLANAYKTRYWIYRNKLEKVIKDPTKYYPDIAPEKFKDLFFFEPNKTINMMGDDVRAAIAMTKDDCREFSDPAVSDEDKADFQKMDTENGFGKLFASDLQTGWAESLNARCDDATLSASVRAILVTQAGAQ
jgi:hypothetical protein